MNNRTSQGTCSRVWGQKFALAEHNIGKYTGSKNTFEARASQAMVKVIEKTTTLRRTKLEGGKVFQRSIIYPSQSLGQNPSESERDRRGRTTPKRETRKERKRKKRKRIEKDRTRETKKSSPCPNNLSVTFL